ncbi:MAG: GGDEF domain-containing protein [Burkholderiaceae bacterium]|nr:GGDEF domain-containing protein [Burkholderiaceae bacterium]
MRQLYKNYGLLAFLILILIAGASSLFLPLTLSSDENTERRLLIKNLSLTSEQAFLEIEKSLAISESFPTTLPVEPAIRNWLNNAEDSAEALQTNLSELQKNNPKLNVQVAQLDTQTVLDPKGGIKKLESTNPNDAWYFQAKNNPNSSTKSLSIEGDSHDLLKISRTETIHNEDGAPVGIFHQTETTDRVKKKLEELVLKCECKIYLIDPKFNPVFTSAEIKRLRSNFLKSAEFQRLALSHFNNKNALSQNEFHVTEFHEAKEDFSLVTKNIPSLNALLLVEQDLKSDVAPNLNPLWIKASIYGACSFLILLLVFLRMRQFKQQIERTAATDRLTSLPNRQAFDFIFQQAVADSERSRQTLCVALIDVDHLKKVNEKNGHLIGDHVLKEIAMIAKRSLRESDIICRWGGEEFLILLKNCSLEKATAIAENLRNTIANNDFSRTTDLAKKRLSITVSMGVAECKVHETDDSVFERAEVALKQAKENGRNGVYFAE